MPPAAPMGPQPSSATRLSSLEGRFAALRAKAESEAMQEYMRAGALQPNGAVPTSDSGYAVPALDVGQRGATWEASSPGGTNVESRLRSRQLGGLTASAAADEADSFAERERKFLEGRESLAASSDGMGSENVAWLERIKQEVDAAVDESTWGRQTEADDRDPYYYADPKQPWPAARPLAAQGKGKGLSKSATRLKLVKHKHGKANHPSREDLVKLAAKARVQHAWGPLGLD